MQKLFKRRIVDPLLMLLKQGVTPAKLAQCVAMGLMIAVFPALGVTTTLAAVAAIVFRLNMVAIQTINYAAYPLQFVLIIPFFRAGAWLFGAEPLPLSVSRLVAMVAASPWNTVKELWWTTWHAAAVWLIASLILVPVLSRLLTPLFSRFAPDIPEPTP